MKSATQLINEAKTALGRKIQLAELRRRYDVFQVDSIAVGNQQLYEMTIPAQLHQNVGFQNSHFAVNFRLRTPDQQFIVDGVAHWPFEALNIHLDIEPAYHALATEVARKAFDVRRLDRIRYGVMPGQLTYEHGAPVFTIDLEHADTVLFYANHPLAGFAGFHRYNCVDTGGMSIVLMTKAHADELVA